MSADDDIKNALSEFSDGDFGSPDFDAIKSGYRERPRVGNVQRFLVAAVFLLLAVGGGYLVFSNLDGSQQQVPIAPSPSVSVSATPSPAPTPTPSPTASPTPSPTSPEPTPTDFPVNPGSGVNPGPVGGVGDVIAGLRLDAVEIRVGDCAGDACPGEFVFDLTNTTDTAGSWEVFAYTYRDGFAALGMAGQVSLGPGESGQLEITIDTSKAPPGDGAGSWSWNWGATRTS